MEENRQEIAVVHHTHWDREWYQTFESMQIRLRDGIRKIMDYLDEGLIENFYLDGQTSVLDDYRQIVSAEEFARLEGYLRQGKIQVGPWYVLADEFLCPPEACVMNLELGRQMAEKYGSFCDVGYLPDTFGHTGAMPQILEGFGIDCAVVWRGTDPGAAEVWWKGSGGSQVRTLVLSTRDGYFQMYLKHKTCEQELDRYLAFNREEKNWQVPVLWDGADHTICDPDAIGRLRAYETSHPVVFKDSLMTEICHSLKKAEITECVEGELRNADKIFVLSGTWSTRMYLKVLNQSCVDAMVHRVQFLQAWERDVSHSGALLEQLWKQILVNEAHDSICGCCVDDTHREMESRFRRIMASQKQYETSVLEQMYPFCYTDSDRENRWLHVIHTTPYVEKCVMKAAVQIDSALDLGGIALLEDGKPVPMCIVDRTEAEEFYHNTLSEPWYGQAVTYEVEFETAFEGVHHKCLEIRRCRAPLCTETRQTNQIENQYYKLYEEDGGITILEKQTGRIHRNQHGIVSSLDAGDTYTYSPPEFDQISEAVLVSTICSSGGLKQRMEATYRLEIPAGLSGDRKRGSKDRKTITFHTVFTLYPDDPVIRVKTSFENQGKDQRLRLEFPMEEIRYHKSDVSFELVKRPVREEALEAAGVNEELIPAQDPTNSMIYAGHLQIVHGGMQEYEVQNREGKSFCYLTMLRCVGDLSRRDLRTRGGGAGPGYKTPEAQCLGRQEFEYGLVCGQDLFSPENSLRIKTKPLVKQSYVKTEEKKIWQLEGKALFTGSRYVDGAWQVRMVWQEETPGVVTVHLAESRKVWQMDLKNRKIKLAGEGRNISLTVEPGTIITLRLEE